MPGQSKVYQIDVVAVPSAPSLQPRHYAIAAKKIMGLSAGGLPRNCIRFYAPDLNDESYIELGLIDDRFSPILVKDLRAMCDWRFEQPSYADIVFELSHKCQRMLLLYVDHGTKDVIYELNGTAIFCGTFYSILASAQVSFEAAMFFIFSCGGGSFVESSYHDGFTKVRVVTATRDDSKVKGTVAIADGTSSVCKVFSGEASRALDQAWFYGNLSLQKLSALDEMSGQGYSFRVFASDAAAEESIAVWLPSIRDDDAGRLLREKVPPRPASGFLDEHGGLPSAGRLVLFMGTPAQEIFEQQRAYGVFIPGQGIEESDRCGVVKPGGKTLGREALARFTLPADGGGEEGSMTAAVPSPPAVPGVLRYPSFAEFLGKTQEQLDWEFDD